VSDDTPITTRTDLWLRLSCSAYGTGWRKNTRYRDRVRWGDPPAAKRARFELGPESYENSCELPNHLLECIHKYMHLHVKDKTWTSVFSKTVLFQTMYVKSQNWK